MENNLFRQKSIKKVQSPDNLKEYIKVINPGLWIVFIAAFVLLAGAFVWGYFGRIEDKVAVTAVCTDGKTYCEYNPDFQVGMKVSVNGHEGNVCSVSPSKVDIILYEELPDGVYSAFVTVGDISPISFIFN